MMKKTVLCLATFGLSIISTAICATSCIDLCPQECNRFYVRGDILYWHTCVDGLAVALRTDQPLFSNNFKEFHEEVQFPSEKWSAGFKLGIGFDSPCDYDIDLTWTSYRPNVSKTVLGDADEHIYVIPFNGYTLSSALNLTYTFNPAVGDPVTTTSAPEGVKVSGDWELCLDVVDFGVGKKLCFGEGMIIFRPHVDLRYARINQSLKVDTDGTLQAMLDAELPKKLADFKYGSRFRNDFWGIGPRVGFDIGMPLDYSWGLYGSFAASLIYGERCAHTREVATLKFDPKVLEILVFPENPAIDQTFHRENNQRCTTFITDLGAGFYWNTFFGHGDCCYHLAFKAGWEQHYFVGQQVATASRNSPLFREGNRDLSTQGLTATFAIGF